MPSRHIFAIILKVFRNFANKFSNFLMLDRAYSATTDKVLAKFLKTQTFFRKFTTYAYYRINQSGPRHSILL